MDRKMTRKAFIQCVGAGSLALYCGGSGWVQAEAEEEGDIRGAVFKKDAPPKPWKWSIEALHYTTDGSNVQCAQCPNRCFLSKGDRGICRSRVNIDGKMFSLAYGNPCSVHIDPIEKKPLNHFYPETTVFSVAAAGCNFRCLNCQNWEISQKRPDEVKSVDLWPVQVVEEALKKGCASVAYTYSEPTTFYEYMFDTAKKAREKGIKNVLVSNGYINREPLVRLAKYLDAANINLKSFEDRIYRSLNGGSLQPVLDTLKLLHQEKVWLEITTLVVPNYVENPEMIRRMCGWILKELGPDYPLHLLRFFPQYKLTRLPPTPILLLEQLREVAIKEGIRYVYLGNVPGHAGTHTYCHACGKIVIERKGYLLNQGNMDRGRCRSCNAELPGRWADGSTRV